ncbi:MAG: hypothetical protein FWG49_00125 [Leptospirales bacterium]|nr:hypothetical protein [Leptospirales bacterium]
MVDIVVSEMSRVLRGGGLLLISILKKTFNNRILSIISESGFDIDTIKIIGQDIGLACIKGKNKRR